MGTGCRNEVPAHAGGGAEPVTSAPAPDRGWSFGGPLPGATDFDDTLVKRLEAAWAGRHPGYAPRTRHLRRDRSPRYTNRLFLESSPYLLQHAHNPVNWYPWGDEAFATARKLGRPVLLSVGYSTCHWCHVMEEESFEDEEIARVMNESYVAVKVDREERPDVDAVYMSAVQMLTAGGGWPMTVWLTPERRPFFGGTYFPARDGDRGVRVGFLTLLRSLEQRYDAEPERVAQAATEIAQAIRANLAPAPSERDLPAASVLREAAAYYERGFDAREGGMSRAPKFPADVPVRFLLRYHRRTGDARAIQVATLTLERMAAGGIYDQVGGGFHRYSTDAQWLVPHFEKMLYDNALLSIAYLEAFQATGKADFARVVRETLRYVERGMTSPDGAFYSATDADSPASSGRREEGFFYTWTPAEIEAAVGTERAHLVTAYYGVTAAGNFEGRTILHVARPLAEVVAGSKLGVDEARAALEEAKKKLQAARALRPPPYRDEKVLVAWNGLMVSALACASFVLKEPDYARRAERAADFVLSRMRVDGRLRRSFKDGQARHGAYLDDYAFLVAGLLDLYEATGRPRWLREAIALDREIEKHYEDKAGGYFMTSDDHEALLAREKPAHDGAEPSGNSVQALNLLRLHELTTDDRYRQRAEATLRSFAPLLSRAPAVLSQMLLAVDFQLDTPKEVVIVARAVREEAESLLAPLRGAFVPNRVLAWGTQEEISEQAALVPLVAGKTALRGRSTAYVCARGVCKLPTADPALFARQILQVDPLAAPN
jgi:uncharacterized protein YyaL (SSP411 family)